ncbi:predicted protein [Phaeodactylum tricornutum CCAP 1055/1]|uniref:Uncharacterized protein n=1 Tax=Phaeodactylum tricornutum (strain CCAP 1055/1) TaxID=556484 RepID=B5Y3T4_PHATC|nr:predicted protein [Phaeodactylum tricornutum CCAP 1055/1]ACI65183.1 predicted protein [Phaeodactylum tricornutum CCAP 1055/1]|eukprot:XP_002185713.1 predicted protein [Phaeodactylum tricornutum CCAP 1055/1]
MATLLNIVEATDKNMAGILESQGGMKRKQNLDSGSGYTAMTKIVSAVPFSAKVSVADGTLSAESSISDNDALITTPLEQNENAKAIGDTRSSTVSVVLDGHVVCGEDSIRDSSSHEQPSHTLHFTGESSSSGPSKRKVSFSESDRRGPAKKRHRDGLVVARNLHTIAPAPKATVLLASPTDVSVLSPLHIFIRQNIEVFSASQVEMSQPAPGRKHPIQLHQIGLRCIHCRHLPPRDRVKRAVCYPSSVGRVYHSVSDMKFDHFSGCKGLPDAVRAQFFDLKAGSREKRAKSSPVKVAGCSTSTAQYYHDTACEMGMVDGPGGVFMSKSVPLCESPKKVIDLDNAPVKAESPASSARDGLSLVTAKTFSQSLQDLALHRQITEVVLAQQVLAPYFLSLMTNRCLETKLPKNIVSPPPGFASSLVLSSPTDEQFLNPLHCFVRRHIEIFSATKDDIAAPSPGRKSRVVLGQVGIRCIHCACLPIKERVKRAVCYPPAISGVYHSVSNMKFDHFGNCRGLPEAARVEFSALRASHGRRNTGAPKASTRGISNSTAQYYYDSAVRMGLVDSTEGIRLNKETTAVSRQERTRDIPDGISALVIAANDPNVQATY